MMEERYFQTAGAQDMRMPYGGGTGGGYYFNPSPENVNERAMIDDDDCVAIPQDLSMRRVKTLKDKMSHRMIEKRRRDRMNTCLEELCRLLPTNYVKQGQGRIEKTEIIESAIRYIQQLQRVKTEERNMETLHKSCCQKNYEMGFNECSRYVSNVLAESKETKEEATCLATYLKSRQGDLENCRRNPQNAAPPLSPLGGQMTQHSAPKAPDAPMLAIPKPEIIDESSGSSAGSSAGADDKCPSPGSDAYKFKKDIGQRFVEASSPSSLSESETMAMPGFILDSSSRCYVPLTLDVPIESNIMCGPNGNAAHPVSIQVKFTQPVHLNATSGRNWRL